MTSDRIAEILLRKDAEGGFIYSTEDVERACAILLLRDFDAYRESVPTHEEVRIIDTLLADCGIQLDEPASAPEKLRNYLDDNPVLRGLLSEIRDSAATGELPSSKMRHSMAEVLGTKHRTDEHRPIDAPIQRAFTAGSPIRS